MTKSSKECCDECWKNERHPKDCKVCEGEGCYPAKCINPNCPCHSSKEEKSDLDKRFDELMFASCPTEIKEPFFWRWTEEGKKRILSFLTSEIQLERERLAERIKNLNTSKYDGNEEYEHARHDILSLLKDLDSEVKRS